MAARLKLRQFTDYPKLHQDWGVEQLERKVTWTELFNDLFYVAAASSITHLPVAHPDGSGVGQFLLLYFYFWNVWFSYAQLITRFSLQGLLYESLHIIYSMAVFGMVLFSRSLTWHKQFSACFFIVRVLYIIYLLSIAKFSERARPSCLVWAFNNAVVAALAFASVFFGLTVFYAISGVIFVFEVVAPFFPIFWRNARLPVHVDHIAERFGLIMMIFLGEGILGLTLVPLEYSAAQYVGFACCGVIFANLHLSYYHLHPVQDDHALRVSRWRGITFSEMHMFLGAAFLLTAAGAIVVVETLGPHVSTPSYYPPPTSYTQGSEGSPSAAEEGAGYSPPSGEYPVDAYAGSLSQSAAWLLCLPYSFSLHFLSVIRASHYFDMFGRYPTSASRLQKSTKLEHFFYLWWIFAFIWPFLGYFIPFASGQLGALGLLLYVAVHASLFNLLETSITHYITSHSNFKEWAASPEAHSFHGHQPHDGFGDGHSHGHHSHGGHGPHSNGQHGATGQQEHGQAVHTVSAGVTTEGLHRIAHTPQDVEMRAV